jgi:phosphopantetheine--protein transferase-like protein
LQITSSEQSPNRSRKELEMLRPPCKIGIDIVNEQDFLQILNNEQVLAKVFSKRELLDCRNKIEDYNTALARRFAAKEAVVKAWGQAVGNLAEIEILHDVHGMPFVSWRQLEQNHMYVQVSLSSAGAFAVAVAVLMPASDTCSR